MGKKRSKFLNKLKSKTIEYIVSNRLFITYFVSSILGTILIRSCTIGSGFSFFPIITDLGVILVIGSIGYFIKPKNRFKYFFTWICIFCLTEIINAVYYVFYTSFASFGEIATISQATTVTGSIVEKLHISYFYYLIFPFVLLWVHKKLKASPYYNYLDRIDHGKRKNFVTTLVGTAFLAISFIFASSTDYSRLAKQWNRNYIVERFGILVYQGNDLLQTVRPKISSLFGYEEAYKIVEDYYNSDKAKEYRGKNKYTGILKGKNIIFVHMESIQNFAMDLEFNGEEVTPNINKLAKEGMFFTNFFPEISTGTSSDTEFTLSSSLMPVSSGTVFVSYYKRNYNTIQKILANDGYNTFSMHGNYASMWNRAKAHPSLGYQDMYFEDTFTYTEDDVINLGINDKLFFKEAMPILENIEKEHTNYMGTIITLSNHSPFQFQDKYGEFDFSTTFDVINEKTGKKETKTTDYFKDSAVGKFLSSVHYADAALGDFINYVKQSDSFKDTVFVFYGDHDAKLSKKEMNYLYNYNPENGEVYEEDSPEYTNYDQFDHELNKKTPLIIWTKNPTLKNTFKGKVNYYMGMIDVQPTLLNMFGKENKYALGHDIFSIKNNNVIPFPNGNFVSNRMYYNSSTEEYKIFNSNTVIDKDYINENTEYVENILNISNYIIIYNILNDME